MNADESIKICLSAVEQCSKPIDLKHVWFLNNSIKWDRPLKAGDFFRSARTRYKLALERANASQKIALGISYEKAYAVPSRSIHANIGGPPIETDRKAITASFWHIILLCIHIIQQSHKLASVPLTGDAQFVETMLSAADDSAALASISGKELDVGDIVFAYGKDLCIVVDQSKSIYGYTSYRVKYLTPPPLPNVPEDWFPARYVHLVCPQKIIREQMTQIFARHGFPPSAIEALRQMSNAELQDRLGQIALKVYNEGGFDQLFKQEANKNGR